MAKANIVQGNTVEELLAEVAAAAHRATSQHGFKGAFIDVELDLWYALQAKLRRSSVPGASPEHDE